MNLEIRRINKGTIPPDLLKSLHEFSDEHAIPLEINDTYAASRGSSAAHIVLTSDGPPTTEMLQKLTNACKDWDVGFIRVCFGRLKVLFSKDLSENELNQIPWDYEVGSDIVELIYDEGNWVNRVE